MNKNPSTDNSEEDNKQNIKTDEITEPLLQTTPEKTELSQSTTNTPSQTPNQTLQETPDHTPNQTPIKSPELSPILSKKRVSNLRINLDELKRNVNFSPDQRLSGNSSSKFSSLERKCKTPKAEMQTGWRSDIFSLSQVQDAQDIEDDKYDSTTERRVRAFSVDFAAANKLNELRLMMIKNQTDEDLKTFLIDLDKYESSIRTEKEFGKFCF